LNLFSAGDFLWPNEYVMRTDMSKVIVERPRIGSRLPSRKKGYRRAANRQSMDERPARESMLGRWHGLEKHLNEHLSPMQRFLRSRVGCPWNKVHQELCEHVSFNNAVQKHVLAHVFEMVNQFVEWQDGKLWARRRWRSTPLRPGEMYICPNSGLLKVVKSRGHTPEPTRITAGPFHQYHLRERSWWEVSLRNRADAPEDLWDLWLERDVEKLNQDDYIQAYGADLVAIAKRPLRPIEIKQILNEHRKAK
jgi:hypothetical protein